MPKPLLCLSSGMTPRYRQDILRVLALPRFSHVQFRYSEDIIDPSLHADLQSNNAAGTTAFLAHVDATEGSKRSDGSAFVTLCRTAILVESRKIGSFYFLRFRLWGYVTPSDHEQVQSGLPSVRPRWTASTLSGLWCFPLANAGGWPESFSLTDFQSVALELHKRSDFASQPFFFSVEVHDPRSGEIVAAGEDGEIVLTAGRHFELRVFHFFPAGTHALMAKSIGTISIHLTESLLEPVTSVRLPVHGELLNCRAFLASTMSLGLGHA